MLGIEIDDEKYSEEDEKDLLSDDNNKNTAIVIDDSWVINDSILLKFAILCTPNLKI